MSADTATRTTAPRGFLGRPSTFTGVSPLGVGVAWLWLSLIVLLPLAAIAVQSFGGGWSGFWGAITERNAIDALVITVGVSLVVALINVVFGTLIAWVLVRDEFPGKGFVNAIIDLPFALPTIVASLVLLSLDEHRQRDPASEGAEGHDRDRAGVGPVAFRDVERGEEIKHAGQRADGQSPAVAPG